MKAYVLIFSLLTLLGITSVQAKAPLRVAVAANFSPVLTALLPQFEKAHNIEVETISAASGIIFQQIQHGAPFDIFLSADSLRIKHLIEKQLTVTGSETTYAIGRLALYSAVQQTGTLEKLDTKENTIERFAIANPNIAPYGLAAKQALQYYQLWPQLKSKLVQGININQTFQHVQSRAVNMGIVALSQLKAHQLSGVEIPQDAHDPIEQRLAILARSQQQVQAHKFVRFLMSNAVQQMIKAKGYDIKSEAKF